VLHWILAASFTATALWTLVPDKMGRRSQHPRKFGPFLTTLIAFFLAEIGDKTQIATVMLAQYPSCGW
jgi:putative Ca2+/H+ antiporter (TMEM165/GDT1 family)